MNTYTRREAIRTGLAGLGLAVCPSRASTPATKYNACDRVELGRTGVTASRLAIGSGFRGGRYTSPLLEKGQRHFTELMRHYLDHGMNFFEMADWYGSHDFTRVSLAGIPRETYVLSTKIWLWRNADPPPSGGAFVEVERFLKELGTDYLDTCLIHCVTKADWNLSCERVRDELSELKSKGVVRAVGVSCHSHEALKTAAADPWTDIIFARINNRGGREFKMDGTVGEITDTLKTARGNGKAVVGMKIFAQGDLVQPDQKDASLSHVLKNNIVDAFTIGFQNQWEVDDCVKRIAAV